MNSEIIIQFAILLLMAIFYTFYFLKQIMQKKEGVSTLILGKGDKPQRVIKIETWLKALSFSLPVVEVMSIFWNLMELPVWFQCIGIVVAAIGVLFFIMAILTMKGSWRAGIPEKKETSLITNGIFRYSRNPAFVGFDLLYLGILIAFPNAWHACFVAAAIYVFHLQILCEEDYLISTFGEDYIQYKNHVRRYL